MNDNIISSPYRLDTSSNLQQHQINKGPGFSNTSPGFSNNNTNRLDTSSNLQQHQINKGPGFSNTCPGVSNTNTNRLDTSSNLQQQHQTNKGFGPSNTGSVLVHDTVTAPETATSTTSAPKSINSMSSLELSQLLADASQKDSRPSNVYQFDVSKMASLIAPKYATSKKKIKW